MAKDRRKKSARRTQTLRGQFLCRRAREIWSEPVTYCGQEFTECHIVAYAHQYHLTLRGPGTPMGIISFWDERSFSPGSLSREMVEARVERLLEQARAGELRGLKDHTWTGCLY